MDITRLDLRYGGEVTRTFALACFEPESRMNASTDSTVLKCF